MDVAFSFVEHTVRHSWCLLRVIGGSGPGVAVLSDVAVQTLIQDLPVLYRCMMCQLCYAFSAHAYERRNSRLCACLPWLEELVEYDILDSYERERSEYNAEDSQAGTLLSHKKKKKYVYFLRYWNIFITKRWTGFCKMLVQHWSSRLALAVIPLLMSIVAPD